MCIVYTLKTKLTRQTKPTQQTKPNTGTKGLPVHLARLTKLVKEESDIVLFEGLHLHQMVQVVLTELHHQHYEMFQLLQTRKQPIKFTL